jgi:hypothetical protein
MGQRLWIVIVLAGAGCSAILGTGCSEKTSADSPAPVADEAPVKNDAKSGPVTIDDEFEFVPPSRASSSG